LFLYEDVSDQLRLESSYNTLIKVQKATLDTLQEGVAVFGPDGRLKLHNAAFARIWRLEPAISRASRTLKRIADALRRAVRPRSRVGRSSSRRDGGRTRASARVGRSGTLRRRIISLSVAPVARWRHDGHLVDATDRFRIESALRERNEALEASDKLKSEFVKRVSYELRTPLNSIMGFAQMLTRPEHGDLNKKQGEYADAIVRASEGLRDLINDILDLSTIEAGAMELDSANADLYTLLSGVPSTAQEWAGKIGLTLTLDLREDAGTFIGDGRRLRQVGVQPSLERVQVHAAPA
jgi:signal transduction histidine kinase